MDVLLWPGVLLLLGGVGLLLRLLLGSTPRTEERRAEKEAEREAQAAEAEELRKFQASLQREKAAAEAAEAWSGKGMLDPQWLKLAEVKLAPRELLLRVVGAGLVGLVLGVVLFQNFLLAVGLLLAPLLLTRFVLKRRVGKKRKRFGEDLGQALQIIQSSLQSGQSITVALSSVVEEAEEPLKSELARVLNETRVGRDLVEALMAVAARMDSEDFEWFASAVDLQRRTGGNLVEIVETVAETIRERFELRQKIRAYSSEGRASAYILMSLPVVLGLAFSLLNPSYMAPLFTSTVGIVLLCVCAVMYVIGYFWMTKTVQVKL